MRITYLATTWIKQHRNEIEDHGEDYSWIPNECASYITLEDVMEAFGKAGIEPFNLYQGFPKGLYNYMWHSYRGTRFAIFIPNIIPGISSPNFHIICKTSTKIAKALGLHVYKYKGEVDLTKMLCPYILCNPKQKLQDIYLEGYKGFVCSTKASDYELVKEESEI